MTGYRFFDDFGFFINLSGRRVRDILDEFTDDNYIEVYRNAGKNGAHLYQWKGFNI